MDSLTLHRIVAAVRATRRDLGWTQQELSDRAGVSRYWVASFESGNGGASLDAVLRVLDVLGLPLAFARDLPGSSADPAWNAIDLDEIISRHTG